MKHVPMILLLAALTGCDQNRVPVEEAANQLENAAAQSNPVAGQVLRNEAEALRNDTSGSVDTTDPRGHVQQALENASNASEDMPHQ